MAKIPVGIKNSKLVDNVLLEAYLKQELNGGAKTSITTEQRSKNAEAVKKLLGVKVKTKSAPTTEKRKSRNESSESKATVKVVKVDFKTPDTDTSVNILRKYGAEKDKHYGNPFGTNSYGSKAEVPNQGTDAEVSQKYEDWLKGTYRQDVSPERRNWIVEQIKNGGLDGKELMYFRDAGDNHAKRLADLVNDKSWIGNESVESVNTPANEQYERDLTEFAEKHGIEIKLRNDTNLAVDVLKGKETGAKYKNGVILIPNYDGVLKSRPLLKDLNMLYSDVEAFIKKSKSWDNKTNMKVHEIWHALTVDYLDSYIGKDSIASDYMTEEELNAKKLDEDLEKLFEMAKKQMGAYNPSGSKSKDGKPYWHSNSREFLAVALAEPKMLEKLNTIKYEGNVTLAQKILSTLFKIIEAATGIKLEPDSMAGELIRIAGASAKSSPKSNKAYNQSKNAIMPGINGKAKLNIKIC